MNSSRWLTAIVAGGGPILFGICVILMRDQLLARYNAWKKLFPTFEKAHLFPADDSPIHMISCVGVGIMAIGFGCYFMYKIIVYGG
jgi:hypothetical protein